MIYSRKKFLQKGLRYMEKIKEPEEKPAKKLAVIYDTLEGYCSGKSALKLEISIGDITNDEKKVVKSTIMSALGHLGYHIKFHNFGN